MDTVFGSWKWLVYLLMFIGILDICMGIFGWLCPDLACELKEALTGKKTLRNVPQAEWEKLEQKYNKKKKKDIK